MGKPASCIYICAGQSVYSCASTTPTRQRAECVSLYSASSISRTAQAHASHRQPVNMHIIGGNARHNPAGAGKRTRTEPSRSSAHQPQSMQHMQASSSRDGSAAGQRCRARHTRIRGQGRQPARGGLQPGGVRARWAGTPGRAPSAQEWSAQARRYSRRRGRCQRVRGARPCGARR